MRRKQQIITSLLVFLVAGMILVFANNALANEYFGLSPTESWGKVVFTLKKERAVFEDDYGHGYIEAFPTIKVISYIKFNKFGQAREGWLYFTPDKKLYRISVIWKQDHSAFKLLKDTLDTKYGQPVNPRTKEFQYKDQHKDQKVEIILMNDDSWQLMSLTYTFIPILSGVDNAKSLNAQKAGLDL